MWLHNPTQRFKTNTEIATSRCPQDQAVWAIAGCWADYNTEDTVWGVISWHREFDCVIEEAADCTLAGKNVQVINAALFMDYLLAHRYNNS